MIGPAHQITRNDQKHFVRWNAQPFQQSVFDDCIILAITPAPGKRFTCGCPSIGNPLAVPIFCIFNPGINPFVYLFDLN